MRNQMNVGLVADWLVTFAGSEKVIKEFINIFPDSELYSVVDFLSQSDRDLFLGKSATTTFIQ
ncbi:glycosyltransferase family 4 protein, partial [Klebsiella pneumoniae]